MQHPNPIAVVGAGIGGLTVAHAFKAQGLTATVYERAPVFAPVGAGIVLGVNAMRVFRDLGLAETIASQGFGLHRVGIRTAQGRTLSMVDLDRVAERTGLRSVAISRKALHGVLSSRLPPSWLRLGEECVSVTASAEGVRARFASGTEITPGLLVGADGLHSRVRSELDLQAPLRDAGQICFRGLCPRSAVTLDDDGFYESWGAGRRFGFVDVGDGSIYWFLTLNRGEVDAPAAQACPEALVRLFADWWGPIPRILAATAPDAILRNDLYDRPPAEVWRCGPAVLLGDAAHPTTPNLGQGAGMAVESAVVLARCVANYDVEAALERYQQLRRPRTAAVTRRSWHLGRIATISNRWGVAARNLLLAGLPQSFGQRQAEGLFCHDIHR